MIAIRFRRSDFLYHLRLPAPPRERPWRAAHAFHPKSATMPPVEKHLLLTLCARTRPGFPQDLVRAISSRNCSVRECRLARIGDRITANLLVVGNWSALGRLETALPGLCEQLDMQVIATRCGDRSDEPDWRPYSVEVVSPLQPELLDHLLDFFASQGVEVVDVAMHPYVSSYTGADMCTVHMVVHVPVNHHPQALRESFLDVCDDLGVDGVFDPIKS